MKNRGVGRRGGGARRTKKKKKKRKKRKNEEKQEGNRRERRETCLEIFPEESRGRIHPNGLLGIRFVVAFVRRVHDHREKRNRNERGKEQRTKEITKRIRNRERKRGKETHTIHTHARIQKRQKKVRCRTVCSVYSVSCLVVCYPCRS